MSTNTSTDRINDLEPIELKNFLIEKTKDAKSPLNVKQLSEEFVENSGSSLKLLTVIARISRFRPKIPQMDSIDTEAKVRMLVALGGSIDEDFLKKLRIDAHVEVDGNNRITKYKAKDGSLEMEGDHSRSAHRKRGRDRPQNFMDDSMNDADDGSITLDVKSPGSIKRAAAPEVPSSSKRTRDSSLDRYIKRENYMDDDIEDSQSSTAPQSGAQQLLQPKLEEAPGAPVKPISETNKAHNAPGATTNPKSGANDAFTSQIKFLEAIQSMVLNLDMPSLSPIQTKIEKKLEESSDEKVPNHEMILAMEVLVTIITKNSVSVLTESVESISLKEFLCYLKAAILNSKLEGLEDLMEKIKARIRNLPLKDKNIPVDKVASALQTALDVIGF